MELTEVKKACDDLGAAWHAFKESHAAEMAEVKRNGAATAETVAKLGKIDEALTKAEETKQAAERLLAFAKVVETDAGRDAKATDPSDAEYKAAFEKYLLTGDASVEAKLPELRRKARSLHTLSDPDGGFFTTFDTDSEFMKDVVETSPMRSLARVQSIASPSLKGRRRTARASIGGWVGERAARSATDTPRVGMWEVFAREQYAMPEATQQELDDASQAPGGIEGWLNDECGEEFGFGENTAFFEGVAPYGPRGFLSYASTDPGDGSFIARITAATQDVIASNDLIDLQTALLEPYQPSASWVLTRYTLGAVRKLVQDQQFVWQPGLQLGIPSVILGRPYTLAAPKLSGGSGDMHSVGSTSGVDATTSPIIAYGDFKRGYRIVDRKGITVLRDPFTNKPYVRFYMVRRVGGDVVQHEALKILINKD